MGEVGSDFSVAHLPRFVKFYNLINTLTGMGMIRLKRAYDPPTPADGRRVLVERLWPRGVSRKQLRLDAWAKEVAPSPALRRWFGHDPIRWTEFRRRYFEELRANEDAWRPLLADARRGRVTLVYAARDVEHNGAVALKAFLDRRLRSPAGSRPSATPRTGARPS